MSGISWDTSELNRLAVDLAGSTGRVGAGVAAVVKKSALAIEAGAKVRVPVDTGNLRSSISTTISGDGRFAGVSAEIGPTASYGGYVEFGTSRMAPAAYMGPAFDYESPNFAAAIAIVGAAAVLA